MTIIFDPPIIIQRTVGRETSGGFLCLWIRQTKSSRVLFGRHAAAFALPAAHCRWAVRPGGRSETEVIPAGAPPLPTGTKKPRRAALQPHSGGKDDELLFTCGRGSESGTPLLCSCGCRQSGRPRRSWSSCRYPSRLPSCQGAPCRQHSESHSELQIQ